MLYVSFTPACLSSLEYTLACRPVCLFVNSTIILSLMVVKSLKPVFILFSWLHRFLYSYWSSVSVSFSYIHTDPLYRYLFSGIVIYDGNIFRAYHLTCQYLTPDSCMLSSDTWLISLITYHAWYLTYNCHSIGEWWPDILTYTDIYTPVQSVLMTPLYSWYSWHIPAHSRTVIII